MVTDILGAGGKERRLIQLIKDLVNNHNYSCAIIVFSEEIHYPELQELQVKVFKLSRKYRKDLSLFKQVYNVCKKFQPHIIQSWEWMATFYTLPIAKLVKAKFVNSSIVSAPDKIRTFSKRWFLAKSTFLFSDAIIGNSQAGLNIYKAPQSKSLCIHNGFDFNRLSNLRNPQEVRDQFGVRTNFVVGMVGAFQRRKDYSTYLKAAKIILRIRKDVTFLAVGGGEQMEDMKRTVEDEFEPNIVFTGKQTDIESIVNIFSIGVLATNQKIHGEGISNSIMEYMAMGKPVVATIGGGTAEIVEDQYAGFLVPPYDAELLSAKLLQLINDEGLCQQMGENSRKIIDQKFTLNRMTDEFVSVYKNLLN